MNERKKVILTYGEIQELGIWSEICKREQWTEEFWEGKIQDWMRFSVHADLVDKNKA